LIRLEEINGFAFNSRLPILAAGPAAFHIRIITGDDIPNMDAIGKTDPYVIIRGPEEEVKTSVKENTLTPQWDEDFHLEIRNPQNSIVTLKLMDKDLSVDDPISSAEIQVGILPFGEPLVTWIELKKEKSVEKPGRLRVLLHLTSSSGAPLRSG
jgi:Ca2+-dependent lipid-binding protein